MTSGPAAAAAQTLALDLVAPAALYYGLRLAGCGTLVALIAGAAVPALNAGHTALRAHRIDTIALLTVATILLGTAVAVTTADPRTLLARGAAVTALTGGWSLVSLSAAHPFCYVITQALLPHRAAIMDRLWDADPRFRHAWRTISVCWGVTTLVDAALRVLMAYRLPVDVVPALDTALTVLTIVVLQVPTQLLLYRSGRWHQLFGPRPAIPGADG